MARLTFILLILFGITAQRVKAGDSIIIKKDPRLDVLSVKQKEANQRSAMMVGNGLYRGFRIQVTSTPRRDDAFRIKAELESKFPAEKTYILFQSPNFRVRIGNFLKKNEAEKLKAELNKLYPNGVYIVDDAIEYTPKEDEDILTQ
jgi:hypothetical protein